MKHGIDRKIGSTNVVIPKGQAVSEKDTKLTK
jgi:hypothetical protein